MSTYGVMQDRIADDIRQTTAAASDIANQIPTAIQNAIRFYDRERFYFNQETATAPTVAGTQNYSLPSDFIEADKLRMTVNSNTFDLNRQPHDYTLKLTLTSIQAQPRDWSIFAQNMWVWPIPDQVYTLSLYYHKALATLSQTSDTNAWMTDAEQLIRSRAKWEIYSEILRDTDNATISKASEQEALLSLKNATGRYVSSGRIMPYWP